MPFIHRPCKFLSLPSTQQLLSASFRNSVADNGIGITVITVEIRSVLIQEERLAFSYISSNSKVHILLPYITVTCYHKNQSTLLTISLKSQPPFILFYNCKINFSILPTITNSHCCCLQVPIFPFQIWF